jgi:hypothetical protein
MTHDELLAKIEAAVDVEYFKESWLALRAVVELHKPDEWNDCSFCTGAMDTYFYPCPTIKAIEKELK